jgi:hypothetical protein
MVCQLAYIPKSVSGACGRTRTYEVIRRLIYSQVLLLLSHTCERISDFDLEKQTAHRSAIRETGFASEFAIRNSLSVVLKNR